MTCLGPNLREICGNSEKSQAPLNTAESARFCAHSRDRPGLLYEKRAARGSTRLGSFGFSSVIQRGDYLQHAKPLLTRRNSLCAFLLVAFHPLLTRMLLYMYSMLSY